MTRIFVQLLILLSIFMASGCPKATSATDGMVGIERGVMDESYRGNGAVQSKNKSGVECSRHSFLVSLIGVSDESTKIHTSTLLASHEIGFIKDVQFNGGVFYLATSSGMVVSCEIEKIDQLVAANETANLLDSCDVLRVDDLAIEKISVLDSSKLVFWGRRSRAFVLENGNLRSLPLEGNSVSFFTLVDAEDGSGEVVALGSGGNGVRLSKDLQLSQFSLGTEYDITSALRLRESGAEYLLGGSTGYLGITEDFTEIEWHQLLDRKGIVEVFLLGNKLVVMGEQGVVRYNDSGLKLGDWINSAIHVDLGGWHSSGCFVSKKEYLSVSVDGVVRRITAGDSGDSLSIDTLASLGGENRCHSFYKTVSVGGQAFIFGNPITEDML